MSDVKSLGIGKLITTPQQRDAIHCAINPVLAGENLLPGDKVFIQDGKAVRSLRSGTTIGVVDPFLEVPVAEGEEFWLWLNPGSITSLRHEWTHPAFEPKEPTVAKPAPEPETTIKSVSEEWMRKWAVRHMGVDCTEDEVYDCAINAGHELSVGPYESARDYINDEWWNHWENITGCKGQRGEYFSCGC